MITDADVDSAGINNTQEGIILTNLDGKIEFVNSMVEKLLIFSRKEMVGEPIQDLVHGEGFEQQWENVVEAIQVIGSFEFRSIRLMRRNGISIPVKMSGFPLKRPSDKESWIVFYLLDISSEISASVDLEKQNLELAKENSELLKEQSNFKRISDMKTKFLGIASHELKTPLTSIKGYSEILLDSMAGELQPQVFKMVENV